MTPVTSSGEKPCEKSVGSPVARPGRPPTARERLVHGRQVGGEERHRRRGARVDPLVADVVEAERRVEEVGVARVREQQAVVAAAGGAGEEVRGVEEPREHPPRDRVHVDGELHQLGELLPGGAEIVELVAVHVVGGEPAHRRVEAHADAAGELCPRCARGS